MRVLPAGMQADLDAGATTLCWCWRVTRQDGVVLGFTDHDRTLSFGGDDYEPASGLTASDLRSTTDLSVDAQDAAGAVTSDRITETDILDGLWDNASVELYRVDWSDVAKRVLMRAGSIGQIRRGRTAFVAEVRGLAHLLNVPVGRTFQRYCDAELGDARCTVDLDNATFTADGEIDSVESDRSFIAAAGLESFASGWFAQGFLTWTSGENAGRRAEVESHLLADGVVAIELSDPPVRGLAAGDQFTIKAGCDKQKPTCIAKFANVVNFRGFSLIPPDEIVIQFGSPDDPNTGGSLVAGGS